MAHWHIFVTWHRWNAYERSSMTLHGTWNFGYCYTFAMLWLLWLLPQPWKSAHQCYHLTRAWEVLWKSIHKGRRPALNMPLMCEHRCSAHSYICWCLLPVIKCIICSVFDKKLNILVGKSCHVGTPVFCWSHIVHWLCGPIKCRHHLTEVP